MCIFGQLYSIYSRYGCLSFLGIHVYSLVSKAIDDIAETSYFLWVSFYNVYTFV